MSGYEADSAQLLHEIKAIDSALVGIILFLSTHPNDENAIIQHNELVQQRHTARIKLENKSESFQMIEQEAATNSMISNIQAWRWNV